MTEKQKIHHGVCCFRVVKRLLGSRWSSAGHRPSRQGRAGSGWGGTAARPPARPPPASPARRCPLPAQRSLYPSPKGCLFPPTSEEKKKKKRTRGDYRRSLSHEYISCFLSFYSHFTETRLYYFLQSAWIWNWWNIQYLLREASPYLAFSQYSDPFSKQGKMAIGWILKQCGKMVLKLWSRHIFSATFRSVLLRCCFQYLIFPKASLKRKKNKIAL